MRNKLLFRLNYWYSLHWIKKHGGDKFDYRENSQIHRMLMSWITWRDVPGRHVIRKPEAIQRRKNAEMTKFVSDRISDIIALFGGIILFGLACLFLYMVGGC